MGKSFKKTASEVVDAPTGPWCTGKREAEDIIRNDNRKKRKKLKKKAMIEENNGGATIGETVIKEKDEDYMDEQDLKVSDAPTEPPCAGKREAEDIRNDNQKKCKKRKKHKKAVVAENGGVAKTRETLIKENDDDYMDEQELKVDSCVLISDQVKVSADINPMDSNPRLGDKSCGVKKNASALKEMPVTREWLRDESENDHPKEESDDGEAGDAPTEPSNTGKREAEDVIRNDNQKKCKKRKKHKKKAVIEENDVAAKTRETLIKEKDGDYMDEQELKVDSCVKITDQVKPSGSLIPAESNSKTSKEDGVGEEESSEEPSKTQVEESVTVPVEDNSSEEISTEEDMAASSDEEQTEMDAAPKEQPLGSKTLYVMNLSLSAEKADVCWGNC